jgi:small subunit ribosomal protein S9
VKDKYFEGIGRRKTSTARVRVYLGDKASTVNGVAVDTYFSTTPVAADTAMKALRVIDSEGKYYFSATVNGGGLSSQADSISLGLARALYSMDSTLKSSLRKAGLVTRDPREVERKKYHHIKSRKKPQFSKR